jgi:hypothetical protein
MTSRNIGGTKSFVPSATGARSAQRGAVPHPPRPSRPCRGASRPVPPGAVRCATIRQGRRRSIHARPDAPPKGGPRRKAGLGRTARRGARKGAGGKPPIGVRSAGPRDANLAQARCVTVSRLVRGEAAKGVRQFDGAGPEAREGRGDGTRRTARQGASRGAGDVLYSAGASRRSDEGQRVVVGKGRGFAHRRAPVATGGRRLPARGEGRREKPGPARAKGA